MNKNIMQLFKVEERKYLQHYKIIYQEYIEAQNSNDYRTPEKKMQFLQYKRGQVVEAGYLLKSVFNYIDSDLEDIERQIERRYLME